jgi:hypothetical protein
MEQIDWLEGFLSLLSSFIGVACAFLIITKTKKGKVMIKSWSAGFKEKGGLLVLKYFMMCFIGGYFGVSICSDIKMLISGKFTGNEIVTRYSIALGVALAFIMFLYVKVRQVKAEKLR